MIGKYPPFIFQNKKIPAPQFGTGNIILLSCVW